MTYNAQDTTTTASPPKTTAASSLPATASPSSSTPASPPTTSAQKECGGAFTAPHGFLTSPSYPENYPNGADCTYIISQPNGTYANMTILDLDLEFTEDLFFGFGCKDFLYIRDGDSEESDYLGAPFGAICGNDTVNNLDDTTIISTQNQVWMR